MATSKPQPYNVNSKDTRLLIGRVNRKKDVEQKLYSLALSCLHHVYLSSNETTNAMAPEAQASSGTFAIETSKTDPHLKNDKECTHEEHGKDNDRLVRMSSDKESSDLFIPILKTKKLLTTDTYSRWKSRNDLERLTDFYINKRAIYLVQIEDLPDFMLNLRTNLGSTEMTLFDIIAKFLEIFFLGKTIHWLDPAYIAKQRWRIKSRHHKKTGKLQYLVKDFYVPLKKLKPKDGYCIMGYSWTDLFPCEELNFVLGEASSAHKAGVVSFGRHEPKSYDETTHKDVTSVDTTFLWKLLKCSSHEMCHLFGFPHCDFFECTMNGSNSIEEAMTQPLFLCPVCLRKLQHACKFDIMDRYNRMLNLLRDINKTFPSENWQTSIDWLQRCIRFLNTIEQTSL